MAWAAVTLNDEHTMPGISFQTSLGPSAAPQIQKALSSGILQLDLAPGYPSNAAQVGQALKSSTRSRSEIFITATWVRQSCRDAGECLRKNLKELDLDYVDLFLLSDPSISTRKIAKVWTQMEKVKGEGLTRSIGVMDFDSTKVEAVLRTAQIKPAVNQLHFNPYSSERQITTVKVCHEKAIVVKAYNVLLPGTAHHEGELKKRLDKIVERSKAPLPRVILAWARENKLVPILTRSEREQLNDNLDIDSISLSADELDSINFIGEDREQRMDKMAESTPGLLDVLGLN
ncbi:NADP-dependent oxidoreductase domain-containing protein [Favolaschia claudopus]|uniref:NADP-dependent oxidoreductase domain-containing protein n=1 Tax=Favolaschia claudopus TaxID=2862362 RepID=A0AAW0AYB8_9AGAR